MASKTYTFPDPTDCVSDLGMTAQFLLPIITRCTAGDLILDPCDNYNEVRCPNDPNYFSPVQADDIIWIQTQFPDPVNAWPETGGQQPAPILSWNEESGQNYLIKISVVDYCTGTETLVDVSTNAATAWVGRVLPEAPAPEGVQGQTVQTIGVTLDGFPDYFYLKIEHPTRGVYYTQVYQFEHCPESVLFEGISAAVEGSEDFATGFPTRADETCIGQLMGWPEGSPYREVSGNGLLGYRPRIRVRGNIRLESIGYQFERNARGLSFGNQKTETHRLRTYGLPDYAVDILAQVFSLDAIAIDGDSQSVWQAPEQFARNNDQGDAWYIDTNILRVVCERQRGCSY